MEFQTESTCIYHSQTVTHLGLACWVNKWVRLRHTVTVEIALLDPSCLSEVITNCWLLVWLCLGVSCYRDFAFSRGFISLYTILYWCVWRSLRRLYSRMMQCGVQRRLTIHFLISLCEMGHKWESLGNLSDSVHTIVAWLTVPTSSSETVVLLFVEHSTNGSKLPT